MTTNDNVCHIIEDLLVEILLRLPPLSVYRFRLVCKQWYSLISNPDFLRTHSSTSSPFQLHNNDTSSTPHDHHQLLVTNKSRIGYVPLTQFEEEEEEHLPLIKRFHRLSLPLPGGYKFIDSCNGLLLLLKFQNCRRRRRRLGDDDHNMDRTYYIYNPINKHYFKLPKYPIPKVEGHDLSHIQAKLVFEPSISLSYKVIRELSAYKVSDSGVYWAWQIYSSKTGSWRLLSTTIPYSVEIGLENAKKVLLNGLLYWLDSITEDVSHCFDIEKERLCSLPLPPKPMHYFRECLYLGECGGSLRLIETYFSFEDYFRNYQKLPCSSFESFDIKDMEELQQQQDGFHCIWTVKYRVNLARVSRFLSEGHASGVHCYKTKNRQEQEQEVLLLMLNDDDNSSIVSFNITTNKFIKEIGYPESVQECDFQKPFAYTPTLYPVS